MNNNNMVVWVKLDYDGCFMDFGIGFKCLDNKKKLGKGLYWDKSGEDCEEYGVLYIEKEGYCYNGFKNLIEVGDNVKIEMGFIYNEVGISSESYEEFVKRKKNYNKWKEEKLERIKEDIGSIVNV
jgi:hypothetical protein